jgi:hypothetical protein
VHPISNLVRAMIFNTASKNKTVEDIDRINTCFVFSLVGELKMMIKISFWVCSISFQSVPFQDV